VPIDVSILFVPRHKLAKRYGAQFGNWAVSEMVVRFNLRTVRVKSKNAQFFPMTRGGLPFSRGAYGRAVVALCLCADICAVKQIAYFAGT